MSDDMNHVTSTMPCPKAPQKWARVTQQGLKGSPCRMALSSLKDYMAWQPSTDSAEGVWKQQSPREASTLVSTSRSP